MAISNQPVGGAPSATSAPAASPPPLPTQDNWLTQLSNWLGHAGTGNFDNDAITAMNQRIDSQLAPYKQMGWQGAAYAYAQQHYGHVSPAAVTSKYLDLLNQGRDKSMQTIAPDLYNMQLYKPKGQRVAQADMAYHLNQNHINDPNDFSMPGVDYNTDAAPVYGASGQKVEPDAPAAPVTTPGASPGAPPNPSLADLTVGGPGMTKAQQDVYFDNGSSPIAPDVNNPKGGLTLQSLSGMPSPATGMTQNPANWGGLPALPPKPEAAPAPRAINGINPDLTAQNTAQSNPSLPGSPNAEGAVKMPPKTTISDNSHNLSKPYDPGITGQPGNAPLAPVVNGIDANLNPVNPVASKVQAPSSKFGILNFGGLPSTGIFQGNPGDGNGTVSIPGEPVPTQGGSGRFTLVTPNTPNTPPLAGVPNSAPASTPTNQGSPNPPAALPPTGLDPKISAWMAANPGKVPSPQDLTDQGTNPVAVLGGAATFATGLINGTNPLGDGSGSTSRPDLIKSAQTLYDDTQVALKSGKWPDIQKALGDLVNLQQALPSAASNAAPVVPPDTLPAPDISLLNTKDPLTANTEKLLAMSQSPPPPPAAPPAAPVTTPDAQPTAATTAAGPNKAAVAVPGVNSPVAAPVDLARMNNQQFLSAPMPNQLTDPSGYLYYWSRMASLTGKPEDEGRFYQARMHYTVDNILARMQAQTIDPRGITPSDPEALKSLSTVTQALSVALDASDKYWLNTYGREGKAAMEREARARWVDAANIINHVGGPTAPATMTQLAGGLIGTQLAMPNVNKIIADRRVTAQESEADSKAGQVIINGRHVDAQTMFWSETAANNARKADIEQSNSNIAARNSMINEIKVGVQGLSTDTSNKIVAKLQSANMSEARQMVTKLNNKSDALREVAATASSLNKGLKPDADKDQIAYNMALATKPVSDRLAAQFTNNGIPLNHSLLKTVSLAGKPDITYMPIEALPMVTPDKAAAILKAAADRAANTTLDANTTAGLHSMITQSVRNLLGVKAPQSPGNYQAAGRDASVRAGLMFAPNSNVNTWDANVNTIGAARIIAGTIPGLLIKDMARTDQEQAALVTKYKKLNNNVDSAGHREAALNSNHQISNGATGVDYIPAKGLDLTEAHNRMVRVINAWRAAGGQEAFFHDDNPKGQRPNPRAHILHLSGVVDLDKFNRALGGASPSKSPNRQAALRIAPVSPDQFSTNSSDITPTDTYPTYEDK